MLDRVFQNVFILGSIVSVCILPFLIYLAKNKNKYNIKHIYRMFLVICIILILPIFNLKIKIRKNMENSYVYNDFNIIEVQEEVNNIEPIYNKNIEIENDVISKIYNYVPTIWMNISILMFAYYLIAYKIYIHKLKSQVIENQEINNVINKIKNEMNIKGNIKYVFSPNITTPSTVGIFRKKIIFPVNKILIKDCKYMIKHEIFHIKNKDIEYKFILLLLNCIYWFNPIVYFFTHQADEILELNCDYNILEKENMDTRVYYGNILLNQIENSRSNKNKFIMNFSSSRRNIMDRFANIVNEKAKKKSVVIGGILISLVIISLLLTMFVPNVNIATVEENNVSSSQDIDLESQNENSEKLVENNIEEEPKLVPVDDSVIDIGFINPIEGTITSRFGATSFNRVHHNGIDVATLSGTDIKAVADGKVIFSEYNGENGNMIVIEHSNSVKTSYSHCLKLNTKVGDIVKQGDIIAQVGSTGNSTGPHLHIEVIVNDEVVDPQQYIYK